MSVVLWGRALIAVILAILGVAAVPAVSYPARGEKHHAAGKAALQIRVYPAQLPGSQGLALQYSLNCDPTSGTMIDPAAACAALRRNPSMLSTRIPSGRRRCKESPRSLSVTGVYARRQVNVDISECGDVDLGGWSRFLPEEDLDDVSIDHGIGPFTLGEQASSLRALLASAPNGTAGGLDVRRFGSFGGERVIVVAGS